MICVLLLHDTVSTHTLMCHEYIDLLLVIFTSHVDTTIPYMCTV